MNKSVVLNLVRQEKSTIKLTDFADWLDDAELAYKTFNVQNKGVRYLSVVLFVIDGIGYRANKAFNQNIITLCEVELTTKCVITRKAMKGLGAKGFL
jgi:hypothetical protein